MKYINIIAVITAAVFLSGCLIFNKMGYTINVAGESGTAEILFHDIRSNAQTPQEFEEDKNNLFEYMWRSPEFITEMKKEGKEITSRELFLSGDTLNGRVTFKFSDITGIENIVLEDQFYYLTLPLEDSVISTNGEIITSQEYKRILWDNSINELKFEILGFSFEEERYRPLGYHFKQLK